MGLPKNPKKLRFTKQYDPVILKVELREETPLYMSFLTPAMTITIMFTEGSQAQSSGIPEEVRSLGP